MATAPKKRGRPPGSIGSAALAQLEAAGPKRRGRPSANAVAPKGKKKSQKKAALSVAKMAAPVKRHALPDLVTDRYCISTPDGGRFLTASGAFSDDINLIMPYDSKVDAAAVLDNLKKELEGGDPVIDPVVATSEVVPFKKWLANSYTINSRTYAINVALARKDTATVFKAAVKTAKKDYEENVKAIREKHRLLTAELDARIRASEDEQLGAVTTLTRFEKAMSSYG